MGRILKICEIFKDVEHETLYQGQCKARIEGMEYDSRKIQKNYAFVAMIGSAVDGHDFIQTAIDRGAKLIIVEKKIDYEKYRNYEDVTFVYVKNVRKKLGVIASNFYDYPQKKLGIIGITGTNGKTTTAYILENILERTGRIGTTGNRILDREFATENTTPESLEIIKIFDEGVKQGVEYFIMEVSSHALEIGRVDMLEFSEVIFTNLTQDHLDFHGTMDKYFEAKKKIFSMLAKGEKARGIVNGDDEYGQKILAEKREDFIAFGLGEHNDIRGKILNYTNDGMEICISGEKLGGRECQLKVNLIGEYNLYNILGAVACCLQLGYNIEAIVGRLEKMQAVPGRFETINNTKNARIVVDFAHTDDGLKNVGATLKEITKNRVITVFGAGGDRDPLKRPKMAKAAAEFSDFVILTSDNPRTEDPMEILRDIEAGFREVGYAGDRYLIIEDREEAIKQAVGMLKEGDSLLVAGKGHETYQIIAKEKRHFDDREIIRKYL